MNTGKQGVIYKYTSPSGRVYIGQTVQGDIRKYDHRTKTMQAGGKFGKAIKKYGFDNLEYTELYKTKVTTDLQKLKTVLNAMEIAYISFYNSYKDGYNSTEGGEGTLGMKHSKETRQKMSKSHTGITHTEKTKKRMSESATGRKLSDEAKRKVSEFQSEPVLQFSKKGEFIKEWKSMTEATKELGVYPGGVSKACNGKIKSAKGFIWKFKN